MFAVGPIIMEGAERKERFRSKASQRGGATMRQILAVALVGMGLAFTASAAMAGESELPLRLQQQAAVVVGHRARVVFTAVAADRLVWPIWHDQNDKGR